MKCACKSEIVGLLAQLDSEGEIPVRLTPTERALHVDSMHP